MSERLPVPPELEHLIEKREREEGRRREQERRQMDLGPLGAIESADDWDDLPDDERRRGKQRRERPDRRRDEDG